MEYNASCVSKEYSDVLYKKHQMSNDKAASKSDMTDLDKQLLKHEHSLSSQQIIHSTRYAFKDIKR